MAESNAANTQRAFSGAALIAPERPQPHHLEAERAVLAAMLREPKVCVDMAIEHLGSAEVFYSHIHREIFQTIFEMHQKGKTGIDLISVANELNRKNKLADIGGELFLAELYNAIGTTVNIESWCAIVREFSILRSMINVCSEALIQCYDANSDAKTLIETIETDIFNVRNRNQRDEIVDIRTGIVEAFSQIQKILHKEIDVGIPSGFPDLDKYTAGLKPGEMFVLAARPSIGKTSLALNIIRNVALRGEKPHSVAFFSLEMTAEQITRRLLCTEAGIAESKFYDGTFRNDEMHKLTQAVSAYSKSKIFIDPTGGLTIPELRAKARRLFFREKIDVIVIDYLQLMKAGGRIESRQQEVAEISSGIKQLAKELNVPVLVLAQLNREIEKGAGASSRPKLSHLRESGAIEQDADIVAFLHRDRDEAKSMTPETMQSGLEAELIVEKNRNGETGIVKLLFFPQRMEFVNVKYRKEDQPQIN